MACICSVFLRGLRAVQFARGIFSNGTWKLPNQSCAGLLSTCFVFFWGEVFSPLSPGGHGAGLGPRGLFCGALRARVGGWPCPRWLSPGSAPQCRAGKLGELAFVRERGDRVGQAACMGLVGCVPVNPGLCIEPECRSPEGLPRRDRAPADQGRRVCVDPGHGVALIGFFPNFCRAIFSIHSAAKNAYCTVKA